MLKLFKGLFIEEEGQGMTEYGLILGAIAVVVLLAAGLLSTSIENMFKDLISKLPGGGGAEGTTTTTTS